MTLLLLRMMLGRAEDWLKGASQTGGRQVGEKLKVGRTACLTSSLAAVVLTSQKGSRGRCSAAGRTSSGIQCCPADGALTSTSHGAEESRPE